MRKFFVLIGILSFGATQPMGTVKEKINNWYERVDVSEKLHTIGSFLIME